jgi:carboxyl-terminal processing protease
VHSVRARLDGNDVGYIRISAFNEKTTDETRKALNQLSTQISIKSLKGYIIDLRNNPGGLLEQAISISDAFLETGEIVSTRGRKTEETQHVIARPGDLAKGKPIIVLINGGSASASEIVAGALQDHKRALVMGAQTFGKGSVQTVRQLSPETALKITTARYYTPSGASIQAKGIVPDVWLDETADGNVFAALRLREADLEKHLGSPDEKKDEAREKAREEARKRFEEQQAKSREPVKPLPDFGTAEDFQLMQAINQLKGKPVAVSKAVIERKAEAKTTQ